MSRSPFLVFQHVIDPDTCVKLAKDLRVDPTLDQDGIAQAMVRHHGPSEDVLFNAVKLLIPEVEAHFDLKYKGTESFVFHQYPQTHGKLADEPRCDNAVYKRKRWIRTKDRDLTGVIWLKDYKDAPPFDLDRHVYGGKLEFPVYNFGFQPQAGTVVVFPSCERFIYLTSSVQVGELQVAQFFIHGEGLWLYDPAKYPGDFRTWFQDVV